MNIQILGSGSKGNAAVLRAGEVTVLLDAGLGARILGERLQAAGVGHRGLDHVVVTHGHLDHARSAGIYAKRHAATLHCPGRIQEHKAMARAPKKCALPQPGVTTLTTPRPSRGSEIQGPTIETVRVPHDCDPTLALRIEHEGRVLGWLTDIGEPREDVARTLSGCHVLAIEANHDPVMLREGPYPESLKARVLGVGGHLSNDQMATMLARMAGPELHDVILLHLSATNNDPQVARSTAEAALARLGRSDIAVHVASQDTPLDPIQV